MLLESCGLILCTYNDAALVMCNLLECGHTATLHCTPLMATLGGKCCSLSVVIAGEQTYIKEHICYFMVSKNNNNKNPTKAVRIPVSEGYPLISVYTYILATLYYCPLMFHKVIKILLSWR